LRCSKPWCCWDSKEHWWLAVATSSRAPLISLLHSSDCVCCESCTLTGQALATASGIQAHGIETCIARGCASGIDYTHLVLYQAAHKGQHTPAQMQAEQSTVIMHAAVTLHAALLCTVSMKTGSRRHDTWWNTVPEHVQALRWSLCVLQVALQLHHTLPPNFSCFNCITPQLSFSATAI